MRGMTKLPTALPQTPLLAETQRPVHPAWPLRLSDLRGAARLAVEATLGVTNVVEQLHHTILRAAPPLSPRSGSLRASAPANAPAGAPGPAPGITGLVYRSVRGVTRGVGQGLDLLLGPAAQAVMGSAPLHKLLNSAGTEGSGSAAEAAPASRRRQAVLAALNGVLGDHLHDTNNPLALPMLLRRQGQALDLAGMTTLARSRSRSPVHPVGPRVLLMVHGLCMNPWQWQPQPGRSDTSSTADAASVDLGAALAAEGGLCLLHLHYNTGLPVATNGRLLADRLQALVNQGSVQELVVVGHSMGGLVARSACHVAQARGDAWLQRLSTLVCLGTPHHGAPLERAGRGLDLLLGISPYTAAFARLGQVRSAGITDLRHGTVRRAEVSAAAQNPAEVHGLHEPHEPHERSAQAGPEPLTEGRLPTPLPEGVRCFAVAGAVRSGALSRRLGARGRAWLGDGLVPVDSALGRHVEPGHCLGFPEEHRWVAQGLDHFELTHRPEVLEQLRRWRVGQAVAPAKAPAHRLR